MQTDVPELALADHWVEMSRSECRCGDVYIEPVPQQLGRFQIRNVHDGAVLAGGWIPPSHDSGLDSLTYFASLLNAGDFAVEHGLTFPAEGLADWLDRAQLPVDDDYLERSLSASEAADEERVRLASERIGRRAEEILNAVPEEPNWLVPGVLVKGWVHKVAGREKLAGK